MNVTGSPLAGYKQAVMADVRRVLDGHAFSHASVLRQHMEGIERQGPETAFEPASLCLLVADAFGASSRQAMPAAAALALLGLMASVFEDLAGDSGAEITAAWGVPRQLNGGDAFFVLAQEALLRGGTLNDAQRFEALRLFDRAARDLSLELCERRGKETSARLLSLIGPAMGLGALSAGAEAATCLLLDRIGAALSLPSEGSDTVQWSALPEPARQAVSAALDYLQR